MVNFSHTKVLYMTSNAVSSAAVAAVVGWLQGKGFFNTDTPYLPQAIAIIGEGNTANQATMTNLPTTITSAAQAATNWGYGSPIHMAARILFPQSGAGVGVPVTVYAQDAAVGSAAKVMTLTTTGTATAAGSVTLVVGGRKTLDGASYQINIAVGDTPTIISDKFRTAVAAATSCPLEGSGTTTFIGTTKWTGLTANDVTMYVDTEGTTVAGVTFAVVTTTPGTGTPAVTTSLGLIGNKWETLLINTYGLQTTVMDELEAFNGIPDPLNPTGRFAGIIWKPFLALSGTTSDDPTALTSGSTRPNNCTIVPCVAPLSQGHPLEAAANVAWLLGQTAQNTPHLDILDQNYPDMPPPITGNVPAMNNYTVRQTYVLAGCSTVDFQNGVYKVKDLITTYRPTGEMPPFYRWVRDMIVYFNLRFSYHLVEQAKLVGKTIASDSAVITVPNVMTPKLWKACVMDWMDSEAGKALITDTEFSKSTITVIINPSNPNRIDTTFSDKITGIVRISATTATTGFNYTA